MTRLLDIIVPHYREPWEDGRKFFDLMEHQRGIRHDDFRVTVVQDGEEGALDWQCIHDAYSFPLRFETIPHGGVSAARNHGMDAADAEWVMFCDFDDMFTSVYSLKGILDLLASPEAEKYDFIHTPFVVENPTQDGLALTENRKESTWTHGKLFRLSFLRETGLRFDEELWYAEDSAFLAMMQAVIDIRRKARIRPPTYPLYTWTYRKDSVTGTKTNKPKFAGALLTRHEKVMDFLRSRGDTDTYNAMALRAMWDMYYETQESPAPEKTVRRVGQFYRDHAEEIAKVDKARAEEIGAYSTKEHKPTCDRYGWPEKAFPEWLEWVGKQ